jgi:hypothetical protein
VKLLSQFVVLIALVAMTCNFAVASPVAAMHGIVDHEISRTLIARTVANFLEQHGWTRDALPHVSDLRLPAELLSKSVLSEENDLEVTAAALDPFTKRLQVQMRCRERSACGSFLVRMVVPSGVVAQMPASQLRTAAAGHNSNPIHVAAPILVRPGSIVTLTMESTSMRLTVPVICLERGSLAQQIKVRNSETGRVLGAEVVGPNEVRTSF